MFILDKIFGTESNTFIKKSKKEVSLIRDFEKKFDNFSPEDFINKTKEFKKRILEGESLDQLLPEAFGLVCSAIKKTTDMNPFDVQLVGGISLHKGNVSEMRTGEGKTLVAVMPAYLNALKGKVHVVTVNDYLARRDAVWMGQIYDYLGISVGVINGENKSYKYDSKHFEKDKERDEVGAFKIVYDFLREEIRPKVYQCDIVYGTNNEYAFDYLRDNIEYKKENIRQTERYFAIVDEVDSILIDEARSPLIISSPANIPKDYYIQFANLVKDFKKDTDYEVDEKQKAISLTKEGVLKFESRIKLENAFVEGGQKLIHSLQNALKATALFKKDKEYIVREGKIIIVDEFTGRLQPGRQWSDGLHQAIEAKENLQITEETRTYASITFQNYFRLYEKLAGMTGTAFSAKEEFFKVYKLPVIQIPTNKEIQRKDYTDVVYQTKKAKLNAIVQKIDELNKKSQPVLVGTTSISNNEELSNLLKKQKIKHRVLNAKNHEEEGEIIADAGSLGAVTIATNLAGRGVDIKLGGAKNKDVNKEQEVKDVGGLFVLGTERHESRKIDDQLRGRCGRQGDVGETQFYLSLEDDLTRIFGSERILNIAQKFGLPEDQPITNKLIGNSIESAQKRIEGHHFDSRRYSLQYDTVLNKQRSDFYSKRSFVLLAEKQDVFEKYLSYEKINTIKENEDDYIEAIKRIILISFDTTWVEHLELMDSAKSSVSLRSYGQREPVMEYKKEASNLFSNFWQLVFDRVEKGIDEKIKTY